ncbi:type II secretion system GspH family protein|uniref:type IV pilus modification PilV family protein n=1 Tax=Noviherbaspirillum sp. L7-7A TaxID=2850560 RepID=UPI001C2C2E91|nr:type II secretion system protein [Noviherbaspirillum sp. L7-7A]MBV0878145.1 type II secretion system GspH family protein [Noviherbaspirillum sp. L7-7A]
MRTSAGFTLLELVAVMVMISVAMLGTAKLWGNANGSLQRAADAQLLSRYAQECAERVIQTRKDFGFTSTLINSTMCDPTPASFIRTVTVPATSTGTTTTACPNGATCRDIVVKVCAGTSGVTCPSTAVTASVTLMLVSY